MPSVPWRLAQAGSSCLESRGRQLDGSRSAFDQLSEIVDAVGDKIDVILDGGIRRGTHVVKALAAGAKACSGGRMYLFREVIAGLIGAALGAVVVLAIWALSLTEAPALSGAK